MPPAYPCPAVDRERLTYGVRARKLYKLIVEGDLTANANGASQDIVLGTLPPGAILMRVPAAVKLNAQFVGGGATSVTLSIGTSASPTLVATAFNIFGSTASGLYAAMTAGAQVEAPAGNVQQVIARITPDAGHTLLALTAGACEVAVYFWNGADGKYFP
jgi:hypothetical protein